MLGLLTFLDPPRPDTRATLETALHYGVQTRMVSCLIWQTRQRLGVLSESPTSLCFANCGDYCRHAQRRLCCLRRRKSQVTEDTSAWQEWIGWGPITQEKRILS